LPKSEVTKRLKSHAQYRIDARNLPFVRPKEVRNSLKKTGSKLFLNKKGHLEIHYEKDGVKLLVIMDKKMQCILSVMNDKKI
jgi:hypothetical protein